MAAGDFSPSALPGIVAKADSMFADPRSNRELQAPLESAKALLENQTVKFDPILSGRQCIGVTAAWLKSCTDTSVDCSDTDFDLVDCSIVGAELESDNKLYQPNLCFRTTFSVSDTDCADIYSFQDKMAYSFSKKMLELDKKINAYMPAFLHANAMANRHTGTIGTISGTLVNIPAALWTPDLLADFHLATVFNEINNEVVLTGTAFANVMYNANFNALNSDQKDEMAKFSAFGNWYADPRVVDTVLGTKSLFVFDAGGYGFFNTNEYTNDVPYNQLDAANTTTFRMASKNLKYRDGNVLKPVYYDITWQRTCTLMNGLRRWVNQVEITFRGGLFLGPEDCTGGSGILEYIKTA